MPNWGGLSVQLVWFAHKTESARAEEFFQALWGRPADQVTRNRAVSPLNPLSADLSTYSEDCQYRITVQPGRMDAAVDAATPDNSQLDRLLSIDSILKNALKAIGQVEHGLVDVYRVSIVINAAQKVAAYAEAAREFYRSVGITAKVPNATELLFQINSRVDRDGYKVNRVLQFSSMAIRAQAFAVGADLRPLAPQPDIIVARRQYDLNIVPASHSLALEEQTHIFRLLVAEYEKLAASGTVKSLTE